MKWTEFLSWILFCWVLCGWFGWHTLRYVLSTCLSWDFTCMLWNTFHSQRRQFLLSNFFALGTHCRFVCSVTQCAILYCVMFVTFRHTGMGKNSWITFLSLFSAAQFSLLSLFLSLSLSLWRRPLLSTSKEKIRCHAKTNSTKLFWLLRVVQFSWLILCSLSCTISCFSSKVVVCEQDLHRVRKSCSQDVVLSDINKCVENRNQNLKVAGKKSSDEVYCG